MKPLATQEQNTQATPWPGWQTCHGIRQLRHRQARGRCTAHIVAAVAITRGRAGRTKVVTQLQTHDSSSCLQKHTTVNHILEHIHTTMFSVRNGSLMTRGVQPRSSKVCAGGNAALLPALLPVVARYYQHLLYTYVYTYIYMCMYVHIV